MKIHATKFGLAALLVFAVFWIVGTTLMVSMPGPMTQMDGHMARADLGYMTWRLNWAWAIYGLVAWSLIAGLMAWAIATVYNRLLG